MTASASSLHQSSYFNSEGNVGMRISLASGRIFSRRDRLRASPRPVLRPGSPPPPPSSEDEEELESGGSWGGSSSSLYLPRDSRSGLDDDAFSGVEPARLLADSKPSRCSDPPSCGGRPDPLLDAPSPWQVYRPELTAEGSLPAPEGIVRLVAVSSAVAETRPAAGLPPPRFVDRRFRSSAPSPVEGRPPLGSSG